MGRFWFRQQPNSPYSDHFPGVEAVAGRITCRRSQQKQKLPAVPFELAEKNALAMELEGEIQGNQLLLKIHISNTNGGHWVPTGEPMRSVLLLVEARDSEDKPLTFIRGSRVPEWVGQGRQEDGDFGGLPGALFAKVLADEEGNLNVPFWQASRVASDTRIRPKKTETLEFVFALVDPGDEPSAEASLIYRPVPRPLAKAKKWQVEDITIATKAW
jgi:hypothetical protein